MGEILFQGEDLVKVGGAPSHNLVHVFGTDSI